MAKAGLPDGVSLKDWVRDNVKGWVEAPAPKVGVKADYSNVRLVRLIRWLRRR